MNSGNVREIRKIIKEIDRLFDVSFDCQTEKYSIYFDGYLLRNVNYPMDRMDIEDLQRTYWINVNGNPFEEVDKANERAEKSKDRRLHNLAEDLAKDIRKPLREALA